MAKTWPKIFVSVFALSVLLLAILLEFEIQGGVVALVILAALPWLAQLIESFELPGVVSFKLREVQDKVQHQEQQLSSQREIITKLVVFSISWYLFEMLATFYHRNRTGGEYVFRDEEGMKRDLRFLRDHGYLEHFTIANLRAGDNLVGQVRLTPVGNYLVELREELQAQQALGAARQLASTDRKGDT